LRKKVLITAPWFTSSSLERLKKNFEVTVNTKKTWFSEEELMEIIPEYDAVIAGLDPFTSSIIEKAKKLKIIARRGIGYDNIDLEACRKKGVIVTITPVPEEHLAVAEFTVGLIIDLVRNITFSSISLKSGSWERQAFLGKNIKDLTVGIIGLGNIGRNVARILTVLGAQVIYYDPYVEDKSYRKVDLETLFRESDVITIHVPKTKETIGMVNKRLLSLMKKGSYLVNTSRAEIMVEEDVIWALENRILKGVAVDVFKDEPPRHDLLAFRKDVITTPHIAAFTERAFEAIDNLCVENIENVLLYGKEPKYRVA